MLRRRAGAEVELIVRETSECFVATVEANASSQESILQISGPAPKSTMTPLTLVVGLPKPRAAEFIVQRCIEAGVTQICFFLAERSQNWSGSQQRQQRLHNLRDSATEQSRTPVVCQLSFDDSLQTALSKLHQGENAPNAKRMLLTGPSEELEEQAQPPKITALFSNSHQSEQISSASSTSELEINSENDEIYLVIGPEGGLSSSEQSIAGSYLYHSVSLGPSVLRTETAALVASGICRVLN